MHDGDDWDSDLGEGLIDAAFWSNGGGWFTFVVLAAGICLLAYHYFG